MEFTRNHSIKAQAKASTHTYTTDDILSGVNRLEKVIELDTLLVFQMQISAAIGFSLDFFTRYQTYLLTQRRTKARLSVSVSTIRIQKETCMHSTPESIIANVCQSLQQMHSLITRNCSNFLAFSNIISDLIRSIAHIIDLTTALTTPLQATPKAILTSSMTQTASSTTSTLAFHFQQLTQLPTQDGHFLPSTDMLENLMNTFGHFKNATATSLRNIDHNVVVLTGEPGYGK
jgi:hypothetical protein